MVEIKMAIKNRCNPSDVAYSIGVEGAGGVRYPTFQSLNFSPKEVAFGINLVRFG